MLMWDRWFFGGRVVLDIYAEVANSLFWDLAIPPNRVTVEEDRGLVTLHGVVERAYQRGSSLKGVGKTDFWVGLGSDRLGSTVSRGDARHRSFPVGPWVEVAVDGDVQRVCGREWSARFVRGFSAWEPVRLRGVRRRGLCGSRHEGRDVAASGLL